MSLYGMSRSTGILREGEKESKEARASPVLMRPEAHGFLQKTTAWTFEVQLRGLDGREPFSRASRRLLYSLRAFKNPVI